MLESVKVAKLGYTHVKNQIEYNVRGSAEDTKLA